jgi:hypothetical protein
MLHNPALWASVIGSPSFQSMVYSPAGPFQQWNSRGERNQIIMQACFWGAKSFTKAEVYWDISFHVSMMGDAFEFNEKVHLIRFMSRVYDLAAEEWRI